MQRPQVVALHPTAAHNQDLFALVALASPVTMVETEDTVDMKLHLNVWVQRTRVLPCLLAMACMCTAAVAAKPEWAGNGNGKKDKHREVDTTESRSGVYFADHQRAAISDYYGRQRSAGKCPPGLAKKHNGCLPPGQAKKWQMGQPLPRDVVFYPLPREVRVRVGVPPAGYRYVRVANDVLLVTVGTLMVVDAIQDLMAP